MRVYLAAPWVAQDEAKLFAEAITGAGHKITEPWWNHPDVGVYPHAAHGKDLDELIKQAWRDWDGVLIADRVVVLQLAKSEGKAFETGLAMANRIPVCIYQPEGLYGHLFQYLPAVKKVHTIGEVLDWLK